MRATTRSASTPTGSDPPGLDRAGLILLQMQQSTRSLHDEEHDRCLDAERLGFAGRLPDDWFTTAPTVTSDREQILVVGTVPEPDYPKDADDAAKRTRSSHCRSSRCSTTIGRNYAGTARVHGKDVVAPVRALPTGRVHGALARALGRLARRLGRVDVRRAREGAAADGGLRRGRADAHRARRALGVLRRARADDRLARVPAALPARADAAAARREAAVRRSTGIGVVGVLELGILAFCLRCEDVLQLPFGEVPLRRPLADLDGTRFGKAFVAMTLGFALVSALVYLAWLLDRDGAALAGARARARLRSGLSLSGHDAVDPGSSWKTRARRLGAPLRGLALGRRARDARRRRLAASRRRCGARRSCASRGSRSGSSGSSSRPGSTSRSCGCRALSRPLDAELRPGAAREDRARRARARLGRRPPLRRAAAARAAPATGSWSRVGRSVAGESVVAIAVLLAAAMLVDSKPPPQPRVAAGHAGGAAMSSSSRAA